MTASFEAKLHGFRRTQDGVVISYTVHPSDLSAEMALAPLGTRYMVAFSQIGDDERPTELAQETQVAFEVTDANGKREGLDSAPAHKERRPFSSLPLSQQAAMRCQDKTFIDFLITAHGLVAPGGVSYHDAAASLVRAMCGVTSRSALDDPANDWPRFHWVDIEGNYQSWLTDQKYAEARR